MDAYQAPGEVDGIGELRNTVVNEPDGYLAPDHERGFACQP